jgi:hypothetical protein
MKIKINVTGIQPLVSLHSMTPAAFITPPRTHLCLQPINTSTHTAPTATEKHAKQKHSAPSIPFLNHLNTKNTITKPTDLHPHPQAQQNQSTHNLQPANSYKCTQLTPKTACVVPPEDGRLTSETQRHDKVIIKVKVY